MHGRAPLALFFLVCMVAAAFALAGDPFPFSRSGGRGGLDAATADAMYLKLDASNDPLTGQLQIDSGASGTQLLVRGNGADAACSPGAAFNPSIKFSGSAHGMGIAQGLASGADELAICNDGARMSIGTNSAEFSFANGVKPDGDDVREMGTSGRRWIFNGSTLQNLKNGTNLAPSISWASSPMTGFATPTTHSISAFSQGVTIWEGGGGVFNLSATLRSAGVSTATAPEWSYQGDQDTGIYRAAANTIGVAGNGLRAATFTPGAHGFYGADGTTLLFVAQTGSNGTITLLPITDATYDLGATSYNYDQVFADRVQNGASTPASTPLTLNDDVDMPQHTSAGPPNFFQLPAFLNSDVTTKPTCSTSADAGKLIYVDDTDDVVVAGVCVCGANAANAYGWRSINNFGVNCHL